MEVEISFRETGGLRGGGRRPLRQLLREYGRRLLCLRIRDWPDFPRRGVMLDISRGRVPKLETLLDLAENFPISRSTTATLHRAHVRYKKYKSPSGKAGRRHGQGNPISRRALRERRHDLVPNKIPSATLRYFLETRA